MTTRQLTVKTATRIARDVLAFLNSGIDPRSVDMNEQIDGHLSEIGLGWKLKEGTYIDGIACQFIGVLAKDIRSNAIEKF
jgi:hypothetical protein